MSELSLHEGRSEPRRKGWVSARPNAVSEFAEMINVM